MSDWLAQERPMLDGFRQTASLLRAGLRRPLWVVLGAAGLGAFLALGLSLSKPSFSPRVVLRVVEADRDPTSMPELKRKLGEYVREGVLTSGPLLDLIRYHGLYNKLVAKDPRAAVAAFRRDIDVDVYQNYFVEQRAEGSAPRSARVALSFRSSDRDTAIAVTRDLGALVVIRMTSQREADAKRAADSAQEAAKSLQQALLDRLGEVAERQRTLRESASPDPSTQVELVSLLGSVPGLERELVAAERRAGALDLGADFEAQGIGLRFDIAEDADLPLLDRRGRLRLMGAAFAFVLGLPLVIMTVGAFGTVRGTAA